MLLTSVQDLKKPSPVELERFKQGTGACSGSVYRGRNKQGWILYKVSLSLFSKQSHQNSYSRDPAKFPFSKGVGVLDFNLHNNYPQTLANNLGSRTMPLGTSCECVPRSLASEF